MAEAVAVLIFGMNLAGSCNALHLTSALHVREHRGCALLAPVAERRHEARRQGASQSACVRGPCAAGRSKARGMAHARPSAFGDDFGQKIDLTARIREILVNYPPGSTIIKEFLQNAGNARSRGAARADVGVE